MPHALVRLKAHLDSEVKVLDLASTLGPVAERNCVGAITPGGEQREAKDQSVITGSNEDPHVNSIRSVNSGEPASERRSPNKMKLPAWSEWIATGREPQMVGDRMVRSQGDVNQGTTAGGRKEPLGVRASVVAKRRLTIVERRDVGK